MNKVEGITKIDLTFGGIINLHSIGGDPDVEECGWGDWGEDVLDLLKMPEHEIPEGFSVELEVVGEHRHYLLYKDKEESCWDFVECIPPIDENDPGGWGSVYQWSESSFDRTYFHFLYWLYWVKVRELQGEKNLPDETACEMHNRCVVELNKIWATFKEKKNV